jgi:hypothetical protein
MFCLNCISAATTITKIDIIVTVISIICTILTWSWAKSTKKIKDELQEKLNSYELVSYKDQLHKLYLQLSKTIRQQNWNTGGKNNDLLSSLENELRDFNKFNKKIPIDKQTSIKETIDSALNHIDSLFKGLDYYAENLLTDLDGIDVNLNSLCNELMSK